NRTAQFWAPIGMPSAELEKARRPHYLSVIARLKDDVTVAQARDRMTRIASDLERMYPGTNTQMGVRIEPLHQIMAAGARPTILMLFGAVIVLFVIVCANIASLQLGRGSSRTREIAVRRALGAGRSRLVRQLLTEALVLSIAGTAVGVALASMTPALLLRAAPSALPLFATPQLDSAVLFFSVALALIAPVLFALIPALSSSRIERLADRSDSGSRETTRSRDVLVACEVALAVVLVVGSTLLIRSLIELQRVDPGFRPDHVVTFKATVPGLKYPKDADMTRAFSRIEEQLRAQPGVVAVGAASTIALRGYSFTSDATPEGRSGDDYEREARFNSVTPDYFKALGVPLLAGGWLTERDTGNAAPILVNASLAKKYYGTTDVVGKTLKPGKPSDPDPWQPIAGVVADVKQDGLDKPTRPEIYMLYATSVQNPATFVIRSTVATDAIVSDARAVVRSIDREILVTDVTTADAIVRESTGDERFRTTLLTGFAGVALFLAALGIYGVLAYVVAQRNRELGIRLALGAQPRTLFRMVVTQGMRPVAIGGAVGVIAAVLSTRLIESLLFDITPLDPMTYVAAVSVLAISAAIACALPARRATRVDPLVALRQE
ncbi:MAG TPA: ADOP family duplicated permease, partial [Vicinamibacterales bacterium]|nr:ADOP family duplicated permease [Vicinamibacterales bacterium]